MKSIIILFLITLFCFILRFLNLSPFLLYPDSYQNLLVAENLITYGNVLGYLGPDGMLYPPFFMWTRPVYAALINLFTIFQTDSALVARTISFGLGFLAIPLAYFVYKPLNNKPFALITAMLLAISFNHTVWSGFVMTETAGVFLMLLFLWSFFSGLKMKSEFFSPRDVLTGMLFTIAILTRYEYAIIVVPMIYLLFAYALRPKIKIFTILLAAFLSLTTIIFTYYPWQSVFGVVFNQLTALMIRAGIIAAVFAASFIVFRFLPKHYRTVTLFFLPKLTIGVIVIVTTFLLLQIVLGQNVAFFYNDLAFIRNFMRHEILISTFVFIGFVHMLRNPKLQPLAFFSLIAIVSLTFIYHRINPEMERYLTHLLPFLLIPAGFGIWGMKHLQLFRVLCIVLVILQVIISAQGLRYLNDASWYRTSYEQKVADKLKPLVKDSKTLLLVSTPEPYYYTLKNSTHSIADTPPYVYISDTLDDRTIIIIQDMAMHDIFPNFTTFLEENLQKYKKTTFTVNENYHSANRSEREKFPTVIYEMKLGELKSLIRK